MGPVSAERDWWSDGEGVKLPKLGCFLNTVLYVTTVIEYLVFFLNEGYKGEDKYIH